MDMSMSVGRALAVSAAERCRTLEEASANGRTDELKAFWPKYERKTQAQFVAEVTGQNMSDIRKVQEALWDAQNKHDG
ncbi:hypothetical protein [Streptomyces sp. NPDC046942]|uniref:hypothetical protein n=1 Tax=Streptomyces sp. NPDC046942 TaxID=3155137 RepID=UPI0034057B41